MEIICPHCGRLHALFWYVLKHGRKNICFRCDRVEQLQKDGRIIKVAKTEIYTGEVPEQIQLTIPEIWTRAYRNQQNTKRQLQFIMTHEKPRGN